MLSALSAYLLKSLRPDNGRAAKITLLGPGRAGFLSPYPAPIPSSFSPGLAGIPPSPVLASFFLPAMPAPVPGEHHPSLLPGPEPPPSTAPRPGRPGKCDHHGRSHSGGKGQGWFCSSPVSSAWEGVCECGPNATSTQCRGTPGSWADAPHTHTHTACTLSVLLSSSFIPPPHPSPSPSPQLKPAQLKSFGGGSAGGRGEGTRIRFAPTEWGKTGGRRG